VVFAGIILGESPSAWQIAGVAVILAGVLAASSGRRAAAPVAPPQRAAGSRAAV
jgi:drug/metabolite transporter (DMT)-like permease